MAFGGFNDNHQAAPMAEINVTPMVDVMLVLLVIFILAAPLFTHAVKLDLPKADAAPAATQPATITLSIDAGGLIYWNDALLAPGDLPARMAQASRQVPQPDLQLRADRATRYDVIAQVMAAAQSNGLTRIGFVTEPQAAPAAAVGALPTLQLDAGIEPTAVRRMASKPQSTPSPSSPPSTLRQ